MASVSHLLQMPIAYDIVVSDFGRDATIEYLRLTALHERQLIERILFTSGHDFFDEYRRIMFTVIGDLAFFKAPQITESIANIGFLTEDILIGLGASPMSKEFADRVAFSVMQEALAAIRRGHERLRIVIPCNGLSGLAKRIEQVISSVDEIQNIAAIYAPTESEFDRITQTQIIVYTVPETVVRHLVDDHTSDEQVHLLILGTRNVNMFYRGLIQSHLITVLPLDKWEYEIIDKTIVASIGQDPNKVDLCRDEIQKRIVEPRRSLLNNVVILEACTDFCLGIGTSSLEVFAQTLVGDHYNDVLLLDQ